MLYLDDLPGLVHPQRYFRPALVRDQDHVLGNEWSLAEWDVVKGKSDRFVSILTQTLVLQLGSGTREVRGSETWLTVNPEEVSLLPFKESTKRYSTVAVSDSTVTNTWREGRTDKRSV